MPTIRNLTSGLLSLFLVNAFPGLSVAETPAAPVAVQGFKEPVRVACVGDSITEGAGVRDPNKRYPAQLGVLLGANYDVKNFGVSGTTMLDNGDSP